MYKLTWRTPKGRTALAKTSDPTTVRKLAADAVDANPDGNALRVSQLVTCPIVGDRIWTEVTHEFV
ncbi:hypothetical protein JL475_06440 [Streptomyces sp. M2CJ-2]|uniref:hypothetical protein n=1 Tax=Streptomyces sp. M2CJ-2 TaxID=2803948 RepID=UPI0019225CB5|nr:hypothetical protein [Streptomyces sp. M2CJ-2]MBL3665645.1 hypothetical protein [Streptomyces sp. M2CJ-2]